MFRRLLEARLRRARQVAADFVDGADDRTRLLVLEFTRERRRLTKLIVSGFAAVVVTIIAVVWATATVVAFAWPTDWRTAALLGTLAFWVIGAGVLAWMAKSLLAAGDDAFALSRRVAAEDLERLREEISP